MKRFPCRSFASLLLFLIAGGSPAAAQTADHGGCVLPSLTLAKAWFDSLR